MADFSMDLRLALRTIRRAPAFATLTTTTLALGIAVTATTFSIINGFLLRPMPASHPEALVVLRTQQGRDTALSKLSFPDYLTVRDASQAFTGIAGYRITLGSLQADGRGDHSVVTRVTGNYFSLLGIQPAAGRLLLATEGQAPGADPVVVLGYSYWTRRFAGDPTVVGRQVELNGHPVTIVGVAPKGFGGAYSVLDSDLYVPVSADIATPGSPNGVARFWSDRSDRSFSLIARLKPGVDVASAEASLGATARQLASDAPDTDTDLRLRVFPENRARPEPDPEDGAAGVALAFMVLAALVLLVACFNVSNVLLVRATARQHEMAVRAALGAGRVRLLRQLVTESLVLALGGGIGGILLTYWATRYLSALPLGTDLPLRLDFLPDPRVYGFALGLVLLTGLIVGIVPAMRVTRRDIALQLHDGSRGASTGRRHFMRNALVTAQVAGSLVLLVVAGLFVRSLANAQTVDIGIDPRNVLNIALDVQQAGYREAKGREFYRDLDARLRAMPGVVSVGQAFSVPLGVMSSTATVIVDGRTLAPGETAPVIENNMVSTGYFDTLHIALRRGRVFTDADNEHSAKVAVINETMARTLWPAGDAVGQRFTFQGQAAASVEVIGIVQDGHYRNIVETPTVPHFYVPIDQVYMPLRTVHIRTSLAPESTTAQVQGLLRELAPGMPISQVQTMEQAMQGPNGFLLYRLGAQLTSAMGLLGLLLAVVGVYSVASYAAAQRTREIGIRMAIGATPRHIFRMVIRQSVATVGIGMGVGLLLAFGGTKLLSGLFYGVTPGDPRVFVPVALGLLFVALIACWLPARRATEVSPLVALRSE